MQRRPVIYVSRVTNLSDARYCAGMGVDLLGFIVDPGDPDYVSPESFQEIVGWLSGPRRVVEVGSASLEKIEFILKSYEPEYLHISENQLSEIGHVKIPLLVEVSFDRYLAIAKTSGLPRNDVGYWLVNGLSAEISSIPQADSVIVSGMEATDKVIKFVKHGGAAGISLQGSREATPGLKDYDHLSRILEEFED